MADALHISPTHVKIWNRRGLIHGHAYSDKKECPYDPPGNNPPRKAMGVKPSCRRRHPDVASDRPEEVLCETQALRLRCGNAD